MKTLHLLIKPLSLLAIIGTILLSPASTLAEDFDVKAKHAIAVEVDTGKILYEKDSDTSAAIASITKILTAYMVFKEVKEGRLTWDTLVNISDYPYHLTTNYEVSNLPMEARQYTVKQLLDASLIASTNSASIALAEHISGSEPKFVDKMKDQLKEWGIEDAKLVNASGLNNKYLEGHTYPNSKDNDENEMSAKSIAIIAHHILKEFPEIIDITKQTNADFAGIPLNTYNLMLQGQPAYRQGVDGLKTGTTERSGQSFVATAMVNNMRVITVVLNAGKATDEENVRFQATNSLLDHIANTYQPQIILAKNESNSKVTILDGKQENVPAIAQEDLKVIAPKTAAEEILKNTKTNYEKDITAPVKANQLVGQLAYEDKHLIGDGYLGEQPSINLISEEKVEKSFILKVWWNKFVRYVLENL